MLKNIVILSVLCCVCLCRQIDSEVDLEGDNVLVVDLDVAPPPPEVESRIIGGTPTDIRQYPYMVQIIYNNALMCAGSLLTRRHVLSAAHCFVDELTGVPHPIRNYRVRAGTTNLNSGGSTSNIRQVINHPMYNSPVVRNNDISVVVLSSTFTLGTSIAQAAIPAQGNIIPVNSNVMYVGWGRTNQNINAASPILMHTMVNKVDNNLCAARYRQLETQLLRPFPVTNSMMCAGLLDVGGRDACQGDSGGPVVFGNLVVGVVSWGYGCAHPIYPGVSARVANYSQWITTTVAQNGVGGINTSALLLIVTLISTLRASILH